MDVHYLEVWARARASCITMITTLCEPADLYKSTDNDVYAWGYLPILQEDVLRLSLLQLSALLQESQDVIVQTAQPGVATQDSVGIGKREDQRGTLQSLHLHLDDL